MLCLTAISFQTEAANIANAKAVILTPDKERLVLMPLRVPEEDKNLIGAMETALVKGLQQKYIVFSGERVAQKAHEIFMKESRNTAHKECDETRCMQNIAEAFQSELIATANVSKQDGSYFLALSIQNIFDNKVVQSESMTCENCKAVQVIDKLKELSGISVVTPAAISTNLPVDLAAASPATKLPLQEPVMVRIPGKNYEMGKYEVTQFEWKALMGTNPSKFANCGDACPVEQVTWHDVQKFIQKLNAKTGKQYRLPTEVEWEYACYGGKKTEYCGGNDLDAVGWYGNNGLAGGNSGQTTHPVGQKQPNGFGLHDMSGNVREWMSDCYNGACGLRVLRGGDWLDIPQYARADSRGWAAQGFRYDGLNGFRLARSLP
jgi:copper chaperone CopZ